MSCEHCCRGEPESKDMRIVHLRSLFGKLSYISGIAITGGEPSLVPELINEIIEIAREKQVKIGSFYLATNALDISDSFIIALVNLYLYCGDNEVTQVQWSNSEYHEVLPKDKLLQRHNNIEKLKVFNFASAKYNSHENKLGLLKERYSAKDVLKQGRAEDWGERVLSPDEFEIYDNEAGDGSIYLNCEGNLIAGCDWSYENQRKEENIICHVQDFCIAEVVLYNKRTEEKMK